MSKLTAPSRLTFVKMVSVHSGRQMGMYRCDCGNIVEKRADNVKVGRVKSCGCLGKPHGATSGGITTPEYSAWRMMLQRCNNKNNPRYLHYGGRGIKVCTRWADFKNFIEDMGNKPNSKLSIDRVNNDGDYTPENCRWASWKEQNGNRRNTVL